MLKIKNIDTPLSADACNFPASADAFYFTFYFLLLTLLFKIWSFIIAYILSAYLAPPANGDRMKCVLKKIASLV